MDILILGLVLWVFSHLFKRLMPGLRARMGAAGKLFVTVLSLAAIALMVIGYRGAEAEALYTPLPGMGHLNNLLMLISLYLMGVGHSRGVLSARIRHPMLSGVVLWAVAHLLVNGDLASVMLFGSLGVWAIAAMLLINAQERWQRPAPGSPRGDAINLGVTLVLYALIAGIHIWLGHNPFVGTYG
ncbi:NnrU family protein [Defluviimonas sp. WL0075]|uniref:NnrU family protein n=1 Tax=Albidovulum sediminicola TaxID=2984331 RepID=A0ABT2Z2S2_9RHOB|nr:NnrU family protein [Defluviimonas sp. WL0075]MCV2865330.1 NnrU family protein [Defluviimonas sp. WL0075]